MVRPSRRLDPPPPAPAVRPHPGLRAPRAPRCGPAPGASLRPGRRARRCARPPRSSNRPPSVTSTTPLSSIPLIVAPSHAPDRRPVAAPVQLGGIGARPWPQRATAQRSYHVADAEQRRSAARAAPRHSDRPRGAGPAGETSSCSPSDWSSSSSPRPASCSPSCCPGSPVRSNGPRGGPTDWSGSPSSPCPAWPRRYEGKDAVLAPTAPVALIAQLLFWAGGFILGYSLMLEGTTHSLALGPGPGHRGRVHRRDHRPERAGRTRPSTSPPGPPGW